MNILFLDGFDHYTNLSYKWSSQYGGPSDSVNTTTAPAISSAAARNGAGGLLLTNGGMVWKNLTDLTTIGIGFSFRMTATPPSPMSMVSFRDEGAENAYLQMLTSRRIALVGASGVSVGQTSTIFEVNRWYFIECSLTFSSAGIFIIAVDGPLDTSGVGNLSISNNHYSNMIRLGSLTPTSCQFHFDDFYITDGGLIGPSFVDSTSIVTATFPYTSASANNTEAQLWSTSDLVVGGAIYAISINTLAAKLYGNTRAIKNTFQPGGSLTSYPGVAHYLSTDPYYHSDIIQQNPATSGTLDVSLYNASRIGFTRVQ